MPDKVKIINRWLVVLGAVLLQVCIGAIYSWSLFNQPLMDKFGWQKNDIVFTFSIAVFIFALSTLFSGRLQDKIGPKKVAIFGGILYGGGLILASSATNIRQLYVYYGIISGAGVGFVYVCPLSTCVKWFPEKKGFITGIVVGSFGLGSLIFKSTIEVLLSSTGVSQTFFYMGIIFPVLIFIGAQFLVVPHSEHISSSHLSHSSIKEHNYTVGQMIKTKSFLYIWVMYLFGCTSGLLVIGLAKDIGIQLAGLEPSVASNSIVLIGLFNAGGRLIWGTLSDKFGRVKIVFYAFTITTISMIAMSILSLNLITFFICLAGIAFCFGGFLAVFPIITAEFYGIRNLGANYGIVYQAYGVAALVGSAIEANTDGLKPTFMIAAILAITGACITFFVKPPIVLERK